MRSSDPEARDIAIGRLTTLFAAVPVGVGWLVVRLGNKMCATGWENRERRLDVILFDWCLCGNFRRARCLHGRIECLSFGDRPAMNKSRIGGI